MALLTAVAIGSLAGAKCSQTIVLEPKHVPSASLCTTYTSSGVTLRLWFQLLRSDRSRPPAQKLLSSGDGNRYLGKYNKKGPSENAEILNLLAKLLP